MDNSEPIFKDDVTETSFAKKCARCDGPHPITFRKFTNNKVPRYDYWDICPETKEPILIKTWTDGNVIE